MEENKTVTVEETPKVEETAAAAEAPVQEAAPAAEETRKPVLNASVDPDKFDWDAFENDEVYGEDKNKVAEEYDKTLSKVVENEVVEGVVTAISKREVIVNIGYKSEGVIMAPEFRYNPDLKVGDKVEVFVETAEDKKGQLILSHKKARALRSWDMVNEAYNNNEIVKGYVKTRTKGGMIVDIFGIEAFLPGSQIDIKPIRDYDQFVDTTMDFKIVKINQEFRNVVVSHKALIEAELEQQKSEIISKLEKGQVLEGTVKNITSYGVFVDLGGVDGLIHITDLSWGRINHPEEVVQLDQKIRVVILDFDEANQLRELNDGVMYSYPVKADRILDAVECVRDETQVANKRVPDVLDSGAIWLTDENGEAATGLGRSIVRKVSSTLEDGRVILQDTNNSSSDFECMTAQARRYGAGIPSWNTWASR